MKYFLKLELVPSAAVSVRDYPLLVWNGEEWDVWSHPKRCDREFLEDPDVAVYRLPPDPTPDGREG